MVFPRNQWYVAAYGEEVGDGLLARTICGEPIVLLPDRGRRRRRPGRPVRAPPFPAVGGPPRTVTGSSAVTTASRTSPTGAAWPFPASSGSRVRRGSPSTRWSSRTPSSGCGSATVSRGDPAAIPRAPWLDRRRLRRSSAGWSRWTARYGLLVDNLMDLSHETYLHGGYIGTPEVAETPITTEVDEDGRHRPRQPPDEGRRVPALLRATPPVSRAGSTAGRTSSTTRRASTCCTAASPRPASNPAPDGDDSAAFHAEIVYGITPSTETTTYDFWMVARDFALDDQEVTTFLRESNRTVVMQDVVALNVLEKVDRHRARRATRS